MKFLLPFYFVCLAFMLSISNIQAQQQGPLLVTMVPTKVSDFCFDVTATATFKPDEIIIYNLREGDSTSDPGVFDFIRTTESICQGQICFDESSYYPDKPKRNRHVIHCEASKGEALLKDGCVIIVGPD